MTYKCILQISAFIAVCSWEKRALLVFCTEKYSTEKKISRWSYLKFRGGLRALAGVISTKRANLQAAAAWLPLGWKISVRISAPSQRDH